MVVKLAENPSIRLLKHVVRCYLRFSEQQKSRNALRKCLPNSLKDQTFTAVLRSEESVQKWLQQLLKNISLSPSDATNFSQPSTQAGGAPSNTNSISNVNTPPHPQAQQIPSVNFQNVPTLPGNLASSQTRIPSVNSINSSINMNQSFGIPSSAGTPSSWQHQQSS